MRFAFKTSPQNTTWPDMLAVWKEADDIEIFESGDPKEITLSSHIRLDPGGDAGPAVDTAAALGELALTWRSSYSRRHTTPPCWPRSPRPSPSCADARLGG